jgi:hypothetical protein
VADFGWANHVKYLIECQFGGEKAAVWQGPFGCMYDKIKSQVNNSALVFLHMNAEGFNVYCSSKHCNYKHQKKKSVKPYSAHSLKECVHFTNY